MVVSAAPEAASPNCHTRDTIRAPPALRADVSVKVALSSAGCADTRNVAAGGEGSGAATPMYWAASWLGPDGQRVRSMRRRLV